MDCTTHKIHKIKCPKQTKIISQSFSVVTTGTKTYNHSHVTAFSKQVVSDDISNSSCRRKVKVAHVITRAAACHSNSTQSVLREVLPQSRQCQAPYMR